MNPAQPSKTVPILAGGLFLGALSAIPPISFLNCACCILVIGGGFLASYLYMKDYPSDQPRVTYGDGALLGLLAGLFGAVVDTVISIPIELMFGGFGNQEALDRLRDTLDIPPQLVEFLETMMAGGLSAMGIFFSLVFGGVIFSVFAMVGAVLGVAILGPKGGGGPGSARPKPSMSPYQTTPPAPQSPPAAGPPPPPPSSQPPGQGGGPGEAAAEPESPGPGGPEDDEPGAGGTER